MKNIYSDKASLILRKILAEPEKRWVARDFIGPAGVSLGLAQSVLDSLSLKGFIDRKKNGPKSYSILTEPEALIQDWLKNYRFDRNETKTYYFPGDNILKAVRSALEKEGYALTLHSGANLLTSFINTDQVHLYINLSRQEDAFLRIQQKLGLKELIRGGNLHFIRPYYKSSVFYKAQTIRGFQVVSPLQLYLDLYHFQPRGREHAEYLKKQLTEQGRGLS